MRPPRFLPDSFLGGWMLALPLGIYAGISGKGWVYIVAFVLPFVIVAIASLWD